MLGRPKNVRLGLGIAVGLFACLVPAYSQRSSEFAVKAAYLTKFVAFIEWPKAVFRDPKSPIVICILGEDPFGASIDRAAASTGPAGRALMVRRMAIADTAEIAKLAQCQMLYIGDPFIGFDAVASLKDLPVVTVTDSGIRPRGVISFITEENHVRFDIDDAAAERTGIRISSKLLELAHAVTRRGTQ